MNQRRTLAASLTITAFVLFLIGCSSTVNTNFNEHFEENGSLKSDSDSIISLQLKWPSKVKFFVEVSGSMNGFFRANRPTEFKTDLWQLLSWYSTTTVPNVTILTNEGNQGQEIPVAMFQNMMNTGAFISAASTKIPLMLQAIIGNIDAEAGEVAVLVSDMKYSPVGMSAPEVLLKQYSTDVAAILGRYGKAVCLVGATSNYLDTSGNTVCQRSPYYYFIIGNQGQVATVRNQISSLLEVSGHFVDNIDSGFDYGRPAYKFGMTDMCQQLDGQPTFTDYEEHEDGDTCTINMKIDLSQYRWIMSRKDYLKKAFSIRSLYGSEVRYSINEISVSNITKDTKDLIRSATADVSIKVFNMPTDSEVLEWSLELPHTDYTLFTEFFNGATSESDPEKSYSVEDFVKGMFVGGVVNRELRKNYILVSKES